MHTVLCANFEVTTSSTLTDDSTCQDPVWQEGRKFEVGEYDLSNLCFESETPHMVPFPDFSRSDIGCPVFSEKLKQLLETAGIDNIDYYPASIVEYEGSIRKAGYYAGNIVGLLSCMDKEESDYTDMDGLVMDFDELVIDEERIANEQIFRLAEIPRVIFIEERFKGILGAENITGLQLIAPKEWDGFDGYR